MQCFPKPRVLHDGWPAPHSSLGGRGRRINETWTGREVVVAWLLSLCWPFCGPPSLDLSRPTNQPPPPQPSPVEREEVADEWMGCDGRLVVSPCRWAHIVSTLQRDEVAGCMIRDQIKTGQLARAVLLCRNGYSRGAGHPDSRVN